MDKKKIFAYVGTWPLLLRGAIPGFQGHGGNNPPIKTGIFGFSVDAETGDWLPTNNYYTSSMTSELCISRDNQFIYSNDEDKAGGNVLSFKINHENGELIQINEQASMGTSPVCVETDQVGNYVFCANLGNPHEKFMKVTKKEDGNFEMNAVEEDGSVAMFHTQKDGSLSKVIDVVGISGISHFHCVKVDPSNNYLLACDTDDKILVFKIDHENGKLVPAENPYFKTKPGALPRTITFHPTKSMFFVNNQNNSTVYSFSFDKSNGKIEELDYKSAVFCEEDGQRTWTSEMAISQAGEYLYVASRSLRKLRPDMKCPPNTIAVFHINQNTGKLELKAVTPIVADNPRGIAIAPCSNYLYVTSMDTNEIFRYLIEPDNGTLSNPALVANLPVPSSIKFVIV